MTRPAKVHPAVYAVIVSLTLIGVFFANRSHAEPVAYPNAAAARFSVEVTGAGPDVILIPGLGCSRDVWDATVEALKASHRVHVLNIAGFAGEPAAANAEGPVIAPSVEALHSYIAEHNLVKPVVVGHSMGGLMALMLGVSHPDDAGKLVVVDALPFIGVLFNPTATAATIEPAAAQNRDMILNATPEQFAASQSAMAGAGAPAWAQEMVNWTLTSDRRVFAQAMYDDMITDLRADLPKITAPVVLYYPWAERPGFTKEIADTIYRTQYTGVANLKMIRIDNSSHFIMLDQPEVFNASLSDEVK